MGQDPNSYQVAGTHYASSIQHWDFAAANYGPGYFLGQVTKYVARWRKKNGVQDLEKARHFLVKLMSVDWDAAGWALPMRMQNSCAEFCNANGLGEPDAQVVFCITVGQYGTALDLLDVMLERARLDEGQPTAKGYVQQDNTCPQWRSVLPPVADPLRPRWPCERDCQKPADGPCPDCPRGTPGT